MRKNSNTIKLISSVSVMALSGVLIVGVAKIGGTAEKDNSKKTIETHAVVEIIDTEENQEEDIQAVIAPVDQEMVMQAEEKVTEETTEAAPEEVKSEFADKFMVNIDEYLNVRASADQNADVVGKLFSGAGGTVLERGEEWTKIQSGNVEGYAATAYLLFDADAEYRAKESGALRAIVIEDNIRVRKEPGTEAGVWGLAEKGDSYKTGGSINGWAEIAFEGKIGYITEEFVSIEYVIPTGITIEEEQEQIRIEEERKAAEEAERQRKKQEAEAEAKRIAAASQFVETVQTSAYDISEEDVYLLACLVCAEAESEPYEGKLAVANVVLNRLSSGKYGNSISSVIYARGQFSVVTNGRLNRFMTKGPNSGSIQAAKEAVSGVNNVPDYHSFRTASSGNYGRYNNYSIIGNQVFYN